jgi:hypothetical protein
MPARETVVLPAREKRDGDCEPDHSCRYVLEMY